MREVTIIVPVQDNAGVSLESERLAIELDLLTLCGGYSRDRIDGAWLNAAGERCDDVSFRYTLACSPAVAKTLRVRAAEYAGTLRQDCVYFGERAVSVSFVEPVRVREAVA